MALMAIWWATGAIPFAATALIPLAILPPLGAASAADLAGGYGNTTLFLILGGFLLGLAMERCNLHRRIAYAIVARAGGHPQGLVLGMMCATGFVSMWVQNTSTTLMMLPVALSVATIVSPDADATDRDATNFGKAIVLGVAYAATIGGLGTIVGTATNALVVGFMQQNYGETISFTQWLAFGIPTVLLLMPVAWAVLVKVAFPFRMGSQATARDALIDARTALGPMTTAERRVTVVFVVTAIAWISGPLMRKLPGLAEFNDTTIGLLAGFALFLTPSATPGGGALLTGPDLRRVPWDVLLLFGGGLALAEAIQGSGLSAFIGDVLGGHRRLAAHPADRHDGDAARVLDRAQLERRDRGDLHADPGRDRGDLGLSGAAARGAGRDRLVLRLHAAGRHAAERHRVRQRAARDAGHDPRRLAREPRLDRHRDRGLDDRDPADRLITSGCSLARMRPLARSMSQR